MVSPRRRSTNVTCSDLKKVDENALESDPAEMLPRIRPAVARSQITDVGRDKEYRHEPKAESDTERRRSLIDPRPQLRGP